MSFLAEINKLKATDVLFGLIGFLGTIGPGFLLIYHYHPELVEKYDFGKLVLFASALTLPFYFAYLLSFAVVETVHKGTSFEARNAILFGALASTLMLNSAVAFAYFTECRFRTVITYTSALTGLILVAATLYSVVRAFRGPKESQ